jgi:small-conductance mechanosensitive channel
VQVDGRIVFTCFARRRGAGHAGERWPTQPGGAHPAAGRHCRSARSRDLRRIGQGLALSLLASALAWLVLRQVWGLPQRLRTRAAARLARWEQTSTNRGLARTYAHHAMSAAHGGLSVLTWLLVVLLVDLWATFVLGQFAYTRPWAERSTQWLLGLLQQFALGVAGAVPGLLSAALIFFIARQLAQALSHILQRVERGTVQMTWLDPDTAGPTRRVGIFVVWLFALAFAYPFLPGANSDAFKGVSVLAGLMLSLGGSSVVGQIIAGLSLMYARTMRSGEYVKIGETEGTVSSVGMFSTKVQTGLGEEVSLPNAWVFAQPVRNFSRLAPEGRFVLHTAVTIGYATPWRQVHAMLLEAARRAPTWPTTRHPWCRPPVGLLRRVPPRRAGRGQRAAAARPGARRPARPPAGRVQRERRADHVAALSRRPRPGPGGTAGRVGARPGTTRAGAAHAPPQAGGGAALIGWRAAGAHRRRQPGHRCRHRHSPAAAACRSRRRMATGCAASAGRPA